MAAELPSAPNQVNMAIGSLDQDVEEGFEVVVGPGQEEIAAKAEDSCSNDSDTVDLEVVLDGFNQCRKTDGQLLLSG